MAASQMISHSQRVTRLYRKALKNSLSWCIDRRVWRKEALIIRARFDANKHVRDRRVAVALVEKGEEELQKELHPDPYIPIKAPDGTLWERNPPLPREICQMTPDEKQWYEEYVRFYNPPDHPGIKDPTTSPYPKYVWSPSGGWYCNPPHRKRNTYIAMMCIVAVSGAGWYISARLERRPVPPYRWIPSQLWCKYAAEDDPRLRGPDYQPVVNKDPYSNLSVHNKWPRRYERVPDVEEVDPDDMVAVAKARHQRVRDRAIHREELKILQKRLSDCVRRETVNHPQRCRTHALEYYQSFRKYRSEGWLGKL